MLLCYDAIKRDNGKLQKSSSGPLPRFYAVMRIFFDEDATYGVGAAAIQS
jgi:hypothetical protein